MVFHKLCYILLGKVVRGLRRLRRSPTHFTLLLLHWLRRLIRRRGLGGGWDHRRIERRHTTGSVSLHGPVILHTLAIVGCRSNSLGRGHVPVAGRGHSLLLLENAVVRIAVRLLDLRASVFLILRGRFLGRVLVLRLHVGYLRLLVHWVSRRGS